ncbi:MAG: acetyl-CoA carboxylase biotin carboxyl carrier protein [Flavobacteriaceae bacterium]|nr:acetyl-CoA carboxylase biotin carboxyl carrier protein [Flavobacteriaceae bacterium]
MDIKDLQNLIKFVSKADVAGVKYKTKDFEINITNHTFGTMVSSPQMGQLIHNPVVPAIPTAPAEQPTQATQTNDDSKYITIKSPIIGTFYRKPSPDKEPFVNIGSEISEGTVVCVVEAMKLFNQIESEVSGKIVKILVDDASPVEYDQPLFLVDPS